MTYKEIAKKAYQDYNSDPTSCASQLTKQWAQGGLSMSDSVQFCKKFMKKNKPNCKWGSKQSHIMAHRRWLFNKWLYTDVVSGRIMIKTNI